MSAADSGAFYARLALESFGPHGRCVCLWDPERSEHHEHQEARKSLLSESIRMATASPRHMHVRHNAHVTHTMQVQGVAGGAAFAGQRVHLDERHVVPG